MVDHFMPANEGIKVQYGPEPLQTYAAITRPQGTYQVPVVPSNATVKVIGARKNSEILNIRDLGHGLDRASCKSSETRNVPLTKVSVSSKPAPSSPPPSRICEDDERRIMLKMEQLLKNEARIVEVEEENRVLTRMVMRLQAENDALKAK